MSISSADAWVAATAALCGVACGVPGVYLVLRRMSLLGDAISHAVLPGLAAAFILTGTRGLFPMLAGAMITGIATAAISSFISRHSKVPEDASLGVVFSSLFALGVIMITLAARDIDLDANCVLYGNIEFTPLDTVRLAGLALPRSFVTLACFAALNIALVSVFYKELKLFAFDGALATAMGFSAGIIHYALLCVVAATTVASFEAVGSVLVVAMLAAPGTAATLLSDKLSRILWIAALLAIAAALGGYALAVAFNTPVAAVISVVLGAQVALAVIFSPRDGLVIQLWRQTSLKLRIREEDLLGRLYRRQEGRTEIEPPALRGLISWLAFRRLRRKGFLDAPGTGLTPAGSRAGDRLIGSHRLWEIFLNQRLGLPPDHVHDPSERMEHFISPAMEQELRAEFDGIKDPQGREIPQPGHDRPT